MNQVSIENALYNWIYQSYWVPQVVTITFDADFVAGNTIAGSIDAHAFSVPFTVDQATTLAALRTAINAFVAITAIVTGPRQITVTSEVYGHIMVIVGPTVTGGSVQPVATIVQTVDPRPFPADHIILLNQVGDKPLYPFIAFQMSSIIDLGQDEVSRPNDNGIAVVSNQRQATVSVHYYGDNCIGQIAIPYLSLGRPTIQEGLSAAGIAVNSKASIQNISAMLETVYEQHASFDCFVGIVDNITDNIGIIERFGLTQHYQTSHGTVTIGPEIIGV